MSPIKAGDTITARSRGDVLGIGKVHTVDGSRMFAQVRLPSGARFNHYFDLADEGASWMRGERTEQDFVVVDAVQKLTNSEP
jgi:hypothetical protein